VASEARELADRPAELDQAGGAVFVDSLEPNGNRLRLDEEDVGNLGK